MDDRTVDHADLIVSHCIDAGPDDDVLIRAPIAAEPLVVALHDRLGDCGARPMVEWRTPRANRSYLRSADPDDLRPAEHRLAAVEAADAVVLVKGERNAAEGSDVDADVRRAAQQAKQPILDARLDTRWVITAHPTPADAQRAEMSTRAWTEYVYDAILQDWDALARKQERIADVLDDGSTARIAAGSRTDLEFTIEGMGAYNDVARENLPGGEVATVPVVDSATGTVAIDYPIRRGGTVIEGIRLTFEDGVVVDGTADRHQSALQSLLDTDDNARRLGEFGIGTNPGIDRVSHDTLFDEKMAGTVHLALGQAMEECVPDGHTCNDSAVHADLLVDVTENARVEIDGTTLIEDGAFVGVELPEPTTPGR